MHEDRTDTGNLGSLHSAQHCVPQQGRTDCLTLNGLVDREPTNYHHRHWVWHIAPDATWCVDVSHPTGRKRVVADNPFPNANNVGPGSTALFVLEGTPPEPIVQCGLSGLKL